MGDVGKGIRNRKTNYAATYMVRLKVNEAQINLVLKKNNNTKEGESQAYSRVGTMGLHNRLDEQG